MGNFFVSPMEIGIRFGIVKKYSFKVFEVAFDRLRLVAYISIYNVIS